MCMGKCLVCVCVRATVRAPGTPGPRVELERGGEQIITTRTPPTKETDRHTQLDGPAPPILRVQPSLGPVGGSIATEQKLPIEHPSPWGGSEPPSGSDAGWSQSGAARPSLGENEMSVNQCRA